VVRPRPPYLSLGSLFKGRDAFLTDLHKSLNRGSAALCRIGCLSAAQTVTMAALISSSFGIAYGSKGQFDRAIEDLDQAIRLNPNFAEAFSNRGNAYTNKGQPDRAIQDLDQAIRLNPNYAGAFRNRGLAKRAKGGAPSTPPRQLAASGLCARRFAQGALSNATRSAFEPTSIAHARI
jgi:tetratricopeptide (TPR) repeat protein